MLTKYLYMLGSGNMETEDLALILKSLTKSQGGLKVNNDE